MRDVRDLIDPAVPEVTAQHRAVNVPKVTGALCFTAGPDITTLCLRCRRAIVPGEQGLAVPVWYPNALLPEPNVQHAACPGQVTPV